MRVAETAREIATNPAGTNHTTEKTEMTSVDK